jgi:hypothetical protein
LDELDLCARLVDHARWPTSTELRAHPARRRRQVVDRPIGPDAEIVERGRERDRIVTLARRRRERAAEMEDPIDVTAIGDAVAAELAAEGVEDLVDPGMPFDDARRGRELTRSGRRRHADA